MTKSTILRSIKLELTHVTETKVNVLFIILLQALIVSVFAFTSKIDFQMSENVGYKTMYDLYAPGMLSTIVIFIAIQLTVLRIVAERSPYGTLDRELLAISRFNMFFGKFIANIIINFIQVGIIFFIGFNIIGFYMAGQFISFLLVLLLTSLIGLSIGLMFSVFSKSKEQAVQLVPFTVLVLIFLSGFLIKLDSMPVDVRIVASNTPLSLSYQTLNDISINGTSIFSLSNEIVKMLVWLSVFTFAGLIKFMSEK